MLKTRFIIRLALAAAVLCGILSARAADRIRVACVGDSITAGATISDPAQFYPAQLQRILGDGYEVRNFGLSGYTMLKKGDNPYMKHNRYAEALAFNPDAVVIKLGTNDSKPQNMRFASEFEGDMAEMVRAFKALPSRPKVFLALPAYAARTAWGINQYDIFTFIIPAIKNVAEAEGARVVDLHSPLFGKPEFFNDGIHPNIYGAGVMASAVAAAIRGEPEPAPAPRTLPGGIFTWNGFRAHSGVFEDSKSRAAMTIVEPKVAAEGKPWIWRPAFFGHEPQADLALLNLGFHVAYLDMTNMYGSPDSVKFGKKFHDYLVKAFGFHPKAVMEGMSRGGYYSLRFAAEYPESVAALYLDAPVCDLRSWPKKRDARLWADALKKWGIKDGEDFPGAPLDSLEGMAREKIAILSVCGDADTEVPMAENTDVLKERYEALGGKIAVITKPGVGHHPHSLNPPDKIVNFIIENHPDYDRASYLEKAGGAGGDANQAAVPEAPGIRARGSLKNSLLKFESGRGVVAFLGGSITEMRGWKEMVQADLKRRFPETEFQFIEAGLPSAGSTPHAFRMAEDVFKKGTPDLMFVEAAVNDRTNGFSPAEQVKGMEGIVRQALAKNPNMDIVMLQFIFEPFVSDVMNGRKCETLETHEAVAERYAVPSIDFINGICSLMKGGALNWEQFGGTHPSEYGHRFYAAAISGLFDKMWGGPKPSRLIPHKIPAMMDKNSYAKGRLEDIGKAKFKSGWKISESWKPEIAAGTRPGFAKTPMLSPLEPGAELRFDFRGTAVGIFCASGPDAGIVEYSVDGAPFKKLDTFTQWSGGLYIPWAFMLEKDLPDRGHSLVLRMSPEKNPKSRGTAVHIRNFLVNGN